MLHICRAEDGEVFQVNTTLWEIERAGSLELFLQEQTGVEQDAVLAYLSDGRRLRHENVRELAGAQDETIFVFNKFYLDDNLQDVLRELRVVPRLQPPVEGTTPLARPSQVAAAHLHAAHAHHDTVLRTAASIERQHEALRIASRTLDLNVLAITDTFDAFAVNAERELDKQAMLLAALEADLEAVSRARIHPEFMSPAVRRAVEAGEKARTLGDYVSNAKMRQVAEGCAKIHTDLRTRFRQAQESVQRLNDGANQVRSVLSTSRVHEVADACKRRAQESLDKITDAAAALKSPASHPDEIIQELQQSDSALRRDVESITDAKNSSTELCINALRRISTLNVDLVQLPEAMGGLQADFRVKTSFTHIQRLHNMLYAYGATIIEIVRRKEFARFFYQRAQTILEVMAKLSANERKRRQIYRGEVHGQLPFDTKVAGDQVPAIDFSPTGSIDSEYSLERNDLDAFLRALDDIEGSMESDPQSIRNTRQALDKLVARMDSLESTFDRIAERSLLSASRLSQSRRRSTEADEAALQELYDQNLALQQAQDEQEANFSIQRDSLYSEISRLNAALHDVTATADSERDRADGLERNLHYVRGQNESELGTRRVMEQRHAELLTDMGNLRIAHAQALSHATEQTKAAEILKQELAQARSEAVEIKDLELEHSKKMTQLLEDQTVALRNLEEARLRGEDLETQIQAAQAENHFANRALKDASEQKDRLLRAQTLEHDRIMRDHIAEADGDRAVLEHQFFEVKAMLDDNERQLKEARGEIDVLDADATGLREELQRTEHELRETRHVERVLRDDLSAGRASQSDFERRLEINDRLIAQLLDVAITFRNSHTKAMAAVQAMLVHPSSSLRSPTSLGDSIMSSTTHGPLCGPADEPHPIDPSDPVGALEALRAFNFDLFSESITKVSSVIRKWQKQCKEYRERSKGKITFRNFAKGDLALFLPTRNSVSKPWAAFNVSFPHYFLQATGRLAEQLKTREWIVARITSITERLADYRDPDSNPYGLGDGVKYYMLEVEDWTQPGNAVKRRGTTRKASEKSSGSPAPERPISPPPAEPPQPGVSAAESLGATRSPTSHLFPVRSRSNSASAGPSSLSRLLAQANPVDSSVEASAPSDAPLARTRSPSPVSLPPPPPSPTRPVVHAHSPNVHSPLRPGSRASSSSRFSVSRGRIAAFSASVSSGSVAASKAAPTTALSSELPVPSPTSSFSGPSSAGDKDKDKPRARENSSPSRPSTPSPTHSASEGLTSVLMSRRRTTSEHHPVGRRSTGNAAPAGAATSATSTLANLASWGVSIGRRRPAQPRLQVDSTPDSGNVGTRSAGAPVRTPVSELLKRF